MRPVNCIQPTGPETGNPPLVCVVFIYIHYIIVFAFTIYVGLLSTYL